MYPGTNSLGAFGAVDGAASVEAAERRGLACVAVYGATQAAAGYPTK
jgi:hypothetical protein